MNSEEEDREHDERYYYDYYRYEAALARMKKKHAAASGSLAQRALREAISAVGGSLFAASFTYVCFCF